MHPDDTSPAANLERRFHSIVAAVELLRRCQCSAVFDEASGMTHDPNKALNAILDNVSWIRDHTSQDIESTELSGEIWSIVLWAMRYPISGDTTEERMVREEAQASVAADKIMALIRNQPASLSDDMADYMCYSANAINAGLTVATEQSERIRDLEAKAGRYRAYISTLEDDLHNFYPDEPIWAGTYDEFIEERRQDAQIQPGDLDDVSGVAS